MTTIHKKGFLRPRDSAEGARDDAAPPPTGGPAGADAQDHFSGEGVLPVSAEHLLPRDGHFSPSLASVIPARVLVPSDGGIDLQALTASLCRFGGVSRIEELGQGGPLLGLGPGGPAAQPLRIAADLAEDFPQVARQTLATHPPIGEEGLASARWVNLLARSCGTQVTGLLEDTLDGKDGRNLPVREALVEAARVLERAVSAGQGFVPSSPGSADGPPNDDPPRFPDGVPVPQPYARISVQGEVYEALLHAAELLEGSPPSSLDGLAPSALREGAEDLRRRVLDAMWIPEQGTFGLALALGALDRPRLVETISGSPGCLLATPMLDGADRAESIREILAERMMQPDLLAEDGIRTRLDSPAEKTGRGEAAGGSSPVESATIARGLRRAGFPDYAKEVESRLLAALARRGVWEDLASAAVAWRILRERDVLPALRRG